MARRKNQQPVPTRLCNASAVHCYQNSVLQAVKTVKPLRPFLLQTLQDVGGDGSMVPATYALLDILNKLDGSEGMGNFYPSPTALMFLGSRNQEDAQEYFSALLDRVEKEAIAAKNSSRSSSPQTSFDAVQNVSSPSADSIDSGYVSGPASSVVNHPFKGMYGMRTSCRTCGYTDAVRVEPFDFITLHLRRSPNDAHLKSELDKFFSMEQVDGVHCNKCTAVRWLEQLKAKKTSVDAKPGLSSLSNQYAAKIKLVKAAIDSQSFDDETMDSLKIPKNAKVATSKTKQPSIARPPRHLIFHIGRNEFNEYGQERKVANTIHYPDELDLAPWILGSAKGSPAFIHGDLNEPQESYTTREMFKKWNLGPTESVVAGSGHESIMAGPRYKLSAVIRHEGFRSYKGHYLCIRREPAINKKKWWEMSDGHASNAPKDMYSANGAYMLFYECVDPMIYHSSVPSRPFRGPATSPMAGRSQSTPPASDSLKSAPSSPASKGGKKRVEERKRRRQLKKLQAHGLRRSKSFPGAIPSVAGAIESTDSKPTATTNPPTPTQLDAPTNTTTHTKLTSGIELPTPSGSPAPKRRHAPDVKTVYDEWKQGSMLQRPRKKTKLVHDILDLQLPLNWCAPMSLPEECGRPRRHSSPI